MPRYNYFCSKCESEFMIFHGINESIDACTICIVTGSVSRALTTPFIPGNKNKSIENKKVGDLTNEFIEKNRKLLKSMKDE